jgi:hypothetical protein
VCTRTSKEDLLLGTSCTINRKLFPKRMSDISHLLTHKYIPDDDLSGPHKLQIFLHDISNWYEYHCICFVRNSLLEVHGNTVRSESRCALRLRYVYFVVSIEVAVEVCCCFIVFSC